MIMSTTIRRAIEIGKSLSAKAVGISGSRATMIHDRLSDYDFCLFSARIPNVERRRSVYRNFGICDFDYFDVDFEVSISDGIRLGKTQCSLLWMDIGECKRFLNALDSEYACDEFLPGGLERMVPLYDPHGTIPALKAFVPEYSGARAAYRTQASLSSAHFDIHVLKWFDKAIHRNDCYSFMKYQAAFIENFITAAYALNRTWYADEKRLFDNLKRLPSLSHVSTQRLEDLTMHRGVCRTLEGSFKTIRVLYNDIAELVKKELPNVELPMRRG